MMMKLCSMVYFSRKFHKCLCEISHTPTMWSLLATFDIS